MLKKFALIICVLFMLCSTVALAGNLTVEAVMNDSEAWGGFTAQWETSFGDLLDIHPYYQLQLSYYLTLSNEDLDGLAAYMDAARTYYAQMLNDPSNVNFKWNWVDSAGEYHKNSLWTEIPFESKAEALRNAQTIWEAFDFTVEKLMPIAKVFKTQKSGEALAGVFKMKYTSIEGSGFGDGLNFANDANTLRRNMMDEMGFENWPIQ